MTSRVVTDLGWAVIAAMIVVLAVGAGRSPQVVSFRRVLRSALANSPTRAVILIFWMWFGWHSFAR